MYVYLSKVAFVTLCCLIIDLFIMDFYKNYFEMLALLKQVQTDDEELNRCITNQIMLSTITLLNAEDAYIDSKIGKVVKNIFKQLEDIDDMEHKLKYFDEMAQRIRDYE